MLLLVFLTDFAKIALSTDNVRPWRGVAIDHLLKAAGLSVPPAPFAMIHCEGGYTTTCPLRT